MFFFVTCPLYGKSSFDLNGMWTSSASNARAVVRSKEDENFVITTSYPSGHSDIYLGAITGSSIPNISSVKGV